MRAPDSLVQRISMDGMATLQDIKREVMSVLSKTLRYHQGTWRDDFYQIKFIGFSSNTGIWLIAMNLVYHHKAVVPLYDILQYDVAFITYYEYHMAMYAANNCSRVYGPYDRITIPYYSTTIPTYYHTILPSTRMDEYCLMTHWHKLGHSMS